MFGKKKTPLSSARAAFGQLGNRSAARLAVTIEGGLSTTSQSLSARAVNISATGCCLEAINADQVKTLRQGTQVMVKVERAEALGEIAWIDGTRCGVNFLEHLTPDKLARLQWIVEHPEQHARNKANSASSWR
jgi:hypothetical protein